MTRTGAALILGGLLALSGCAERASEPKVASLCSTGDRSACQSMDDARQLRDAAAYQTEPVLGFASIPQGVYLPMPIVNRNAAP